MFRIKGNTFVPKIAMLLALLMLVIGCTQQNAASTDTKEMVTSDTAQTNKAITVAWLRDIGPLNPHVYYPSQLFAQSMLYEPLVSYKEGGQLKPYLAESWTISADGKEYTFKLRKDVKFSDGSSFNAFLVKKNFDAIMVNKSVHSWVGLVKVLKQTEAVDEHTFKITLTDPYYPTLQDLAIVRPFRFLAEAGFPDDGNTTKDIKKPIGTGPWLLADYKQDQYAVFTRNPNYWGDVPKIDKITVKIIPDGETRVLAFEKGELDLIFGEGAISMDAFQQLKASGKYETELSEPVGTRSLLLNTLNEKLADHRVRLALQHGFNKAAMVKGITGDVEEKADNILSKNYPYSNINAQPINYNVDKAKAYLEEAGWKLKAGQTVREKDGQRLELELMYDKGDLIQKTMAETIQSQWGEIGVKLNLSSVELAVIPKRLREGQFDIHFWFNYGVPYDPHSLINSVSEPNFGISEAHSRIPMKAELDQQIHAALASTDETKRQELYTSILKTLHEQSVILPISYIKQTVVYQKKIKNFKFPASRWDHPFDGITIKP
ncbi:nickel ABC transporter substrate-binding protein [Paenibacillus periandrae]|uniref:nickel ABC transporter substrate-binding protein n=1 Tax=Paenibacillus periandrae TaxID=1761741 RepID=UPI001F0911A5|nr:nickel ABC transporter substrate-binding protein [Paenibacillus periandrae]